MIIIEGADLVGKTSFARKLLDHPALAEAGYIYKHFSRLPKSFDYCAAYMSNAYKNSVQDRFHMSEPVYSRVRGEKESMLSPEMYRLVDAHLRMIGSYTVIITADEHLLPDRYREGEMYGVEPILQANKLFQAIARDPVGISGYEMDWDCHIACTRDAPFPPDYNVEFVIQEYLNRQAQVSLAMENVNDGPHYR